MLLLNGWINAALLQADRALPPHYAAVESIRLLWLLRCRLDEAVFLLLLAYAGVMFLGMYVVEGVV
ncbi:hypothetical protein [Paenibacillus sp. YYML68]|uniref:hypothetical protein n=1 Tax=Paenibacillus sp. YYML68 TaxID=2909250 RepID=UPI002490FB9D|nr:hypothetical protein [Paenibacillus sp. YYML68]